MLFGVSSCGIDVNIARTNTNFLLVSQFCRYIYVYTLLPSPWLEIKPIKAAESRAASSLFKPVSFVMLTVQN